MDAFAWGVVGAVAAVAGVIVAIVLGVIPLMQARRKAQAAAVIAAQRLDYPTYLARLRTVPVRDLLKRAIAEPYPHSVAEAIVLAMDAVSEGDPTALCRGLINVRRCRSRCRAAAWSSRGSGSTAV